MACLLARSGAIRCDQVRSGAIRCEQVRTGAIRCDRRGESVETGSKPVIETQVRDFEAVYQEHAAELINSSLGQRFGVRDDSQNPDLFDIGSFYRQDCFVVALHGGEVVGTGALIFETKLAVRVVRMHTALQFRRMGIATAIIDELEKRARDYRARELFLDTDNDWNDAHAFYLACGYEELRRNESGIRFHKLLVHDDQ